MKSIFIMIMIFSYINAAVAQKPNTALVDSIKSGITSFFIAENLLDQKKVGNNTNYIFAIEVREKRGLGDLDKGIYRIGVYQSHSPEYIMIVEGNKFTIFNLSEVTKVLNAVIKYSERYKLTDENLFDYFKEVINIYQFNHDNGSSRVPKSKHIAL